MMVTRRYQWLVALGVGTLTIVLIRAASGPARVEMRRGRATAPPPQAHTPSEIARQEARRWYGAARRRANEQREGVAEWDPHAQEAAGPEVMRRGVIRDAHELQLAVAAAERAAKLAATQEEKYQAALLLSRLYCDADAHDRELTQARRLVAMAPRNWTTLKVLRRAAGCNHLDALARQTDRLLETVPQDSGPGKRVSLSSS